MTAIGTHNCRGEHLLFENEKETNCFILCLYLFCRKFVSRMICFRPPKCCGPSMTASQWFGQVWRRQHSTKVDGSQAKRHWNAEVIQFLPPPTIKLAECRKSPLAINTHWYAYSLSPRRLVSSLKAQSTTQSESTAPPIIEPIVSDTKRRRLHQCRLKECEKGSLAIPTKSPFVFVLFRRIKWLKPPY